MFKIKISSDSEPLDIKCSYCDSVYDFREHKSCPNCAAVPDKEQINAAKAEAREARLAETAAAAAASVPKTGKFMRLLIKLIPVWAFLIFALLIISGAAQASARKNIIDGLQTVDTPSYVTHEMGEKFVFGKAFTVSADEAFIADSPAAAALLPEGFKLLAVHINAACDGSEKLGYYGFEPVYISVGEVCRAPVSGSSLRSMPDAFAQTSFYFGSADYDYDRDGYLCFIVEDGVTEVELCFEDIHTEKGVRQLDCVHKISIDLTEVQNG